MDHTAQSDGDASRRFSVLLEFAAKLNSEIDDIDLVYGEALEYLRHVVQFDSASVQVLENGMIRIVAAGGFDDSEAVSRIAFPLDKMFPNYEVVESRAPLMIPDVRQAYPHFETASGEYDSGHIRTWLGVPLIARDEVVGMIALDRVTVHPFSEMEIHMVSGFAAHIASAIRNAQLYQELDSANKTKETILRELHHRVKNNMQLISSLLSLRADGLKAVEARSVLHELQTKVMVLAEVHERLYESVHIGTVDLGEYTDGIARSVVAGYSKGAVVNLNVRTASVEAGLDLAVPHGLVVSELVLNALKHAGVGDRPLDLSIELEQRADGVYTRVSDNGPGIPSSVDPMSSDSFGISMIVSLVEQLNGSIAPVTNGGATWRIYYPAASCRPRRHNN